MSIYDSILRQAGELAPQLRKIRRDLHAHAETGWFEIRTSSLIARRLTQLGYRVLTGPEVCLAESRMGLPGQEALDEQYRRALEQGAVQPWAGRARDGFTGVIGILDCGEGPSIALRFDIDALGVFEDGSSGHRPAREGFRSKNEGMMHACGHDGHTAIGLGAAQVLMTLRDRLRGKIKLIFQPAEEGVRGARAIVDRGHLDGVDYVIGSHMGKSAGDAQIGFSTGSTLATSKLDALFTGRAAHAGASPEAGDNALLAAASAVLNLHAIPRSSAGDTRINVGTLHAGSGRNVVCDRARLEIEVRGATTETNRYVEDYARRILRAAAEMHGCSCEVTLMGNAESLRSDGEMIERCARVCREKLGLRTAPPRSGAGASEDFAYMVNRVRAQGGQGLFFSTLTPCAGPFHSRQFDFQEEALSSAVCVFCGLTCDLMGL